MISESTAHGGSDPFKLVADALDDAVKAVKAGAGEARATVSRTIPAAHGFLTGMVYKTTYAVSYGFVFPAAMIASAIPKNNAIVTGFMDGARAAVDAVGERQCRELACDAPAASLEHAGPDENTATAI